MSLAVDRCLESRVCTCHLIESPGIHESIKSFKARVQLCKEGLGIVGKELTRNDVLLLKEEAITSVNEDIDIYVAKSKAEESDAMRVAEIKAARAVESGNNARSSNNSVFSSMFPSSASQLPPYLRLWRTLRRVDQYKTDVEASKRVHDIAHVLDMVKMRGMFFYFIHLHV
jgi:hypothetical protein